jgi:hypothetical protein
VSPLRLLPCLLLRLLRCFLLCLLLCLPLCLLLSLLFGRHHFDLPHGLP